MLTKEYVISLTRKAAESGTTLQDILNNNGLTPSENLPTGNRAVVGLTEEKACELASKLTGTARVEELVFGPHPDTPLDHIPQDLLKTDPNQEL